MKIICVGWNYPAHNRELKVEERPVNPTIFLKPDSALLKKGVPLYIPDFTQQLEHEVEVVVKINKVGKSIATRFAHRYYDEVTLGIDFTARDLQQQFRASGAPWELSKGFDGSAAVGDFLPLNELGHSQKLSFELSVNDELRQKGNTSDMLFSIDEIIAYVSRFFTLKTGDLIFTGTPSGVGLVCEDDRLVGILNGRKVLDFYAK